MWWIISWTLIGRALSRAAGLETLARENGCWIFFFFFASTLVFCCCAAPPALSLNFFFFFIQLLLPFITFLLLTTLVNHKICLLLGAGSYFHKVLVLGCFFLQRFLFGLLRTSGVFSSSSIPPFWRVFFDMWRASTKDRQSLDSFDPPAALDAVALSSLREGEGGIEVITHHGFGDFGNCAAIEY